MAHHQGLCQKLIGSELGAGRLWSEWIRSLVKGQEKRAVWQYTKETRGVFQSFAVVFSHESLSCERGETWQLTPLTDTLCGGLACGNIWKMTLMVHLIPHTAGVWSSFLFGSERTCMWKIKSFQMQNVVCQWLFDGIHRYPWGFAASCREAATAQRTSSPPSRQIGSS